MICSQRLELACSHVLRLDQIVVISRADDEQHTIFSSKKVDDPRPAGNAPRKRLVRIAERSVDDDHMRRSRRVAFTHSHQRFLEKVGRKTIWKTLGVRRISRRIQHIDEIDRTFERAIPHLIKITVDDGRSHCGAMLAWSDSQRFKPERVIDAERAREPRVGGEWDGIEDRGDRIAVKRGRYAVRRAVDFLNRNQLEDALRPDLQHRFLASQAGRITGKRRSNGACRHIAQQRMIASTRDARTPDHLATDRLDSRACLLLCRLAILTKHQLDFDADRLRLPAGFRAQDFIVGGRNTILRSPRSDIAQLRE